MSKVKGNEVEDLPAGEDQPGGEDAFETDFDAFSDGNDVDQVQNENEIEVETPEVDEANPSEADGIEDDADPSVEDADVDDYAPPTKKEWEKAQQEIRSNRGRISSFQRQANENAAAQAKARLEQDPNKDDKAENNPLKSDEWKALEEDYSEIATPVKNLVQGMAKKLDDANARVATLEGRSENDQVMENVSILADKHSDWVDIAKSQDFTDYIRSQPAPVQKVFDDNQSTIGNPNEVAWIIDLYKDSLPSTQDDVDPNPEPTPQPKTALQKKRERQMESAGNPSPRRGSAPATSAGGDFEDMFDHYASKKQLIERIKL